MSKQQTSQSNFGIYSLYVLGAIEIGRAHV